MKTTEYKGIDYGLGLSNVDRETGIRYGVGVTIDTQTNKEDRTMETSEQNAVGQGNIQAFFEHLTGEYVNHFRNDPEYAYAASHITPEALARKMTLGLASGSANKDGKAIQATCKHFRIPHTYKAIRAFFGV